MEGAHQNMRKKVLWSEEVKVKRFGGYETCCDRKKMEHTNTISPL